MNRHVIEGVAIPAVRAGRLRGVLLVETLREGVRTETRLLSKKSEVLWPGLGPLRDALPNLELEQASRPESLHELAANLVHTMRVSARATLRLAVAGPWIPESERHEHSLFRDIRAVGALTTIDVSRVIAAQRATKRLLARRSFAGAKVVFLSCTTASTATACAVLNSGEATTVDFFHGAGIEQVHGGVESPARIHATWTKLDAEAFATVGSTAMEGGMAVRVRPTTARGRKRILIMSNYAHRDEHRPYSLPFQDELLRITKLAPAGFEFRWRPHPADDPQRVQRTLQALSGVHLSQGAPLEEDVGWASIVVSSMSSALIEALFAGVPVFVQLPPHFDGLHVFSFVPRERAFFYADDLWPKLLDVQGALERGLDASEPERQARQMLFGGRDGQPPEFDLDLTTASLIQPRR